MQAVSNRAMFALPDFMASSNGRTQRERPRPLHLSKSFTRVEPPSPERLTRNQRASTIQNGVIPESTMADVSRENTKPQPDAFERTSEDDEDAGTPVEEPGKLPDNFDELPIELASLSDRFVST